MFSKKYLIGAFLVISLLIFGCGTSIPDNIDAGADIIEDGMNVGDEILEDDSEVMDDEAIDQMLDVPVDDYGRETVSVDSMNKISLEELALHNTEDDCWIAYEGKVYDYTATSGHPSMDDAIFAHCGNPTSFEEAAKARHSSSSEDRVNNYGPLVGELE